jgi:hypothetical protein
MNRIARLEKLERSRQAGERLFAVHRFARETTEDTLRIEHPDAAVTDRDLVVILTMFADEPRESCWRPMQTDGQGNRIYKGDPRYIDRPWTPPDWYREKIAANITPGVSCEA